MKYKNRLYTPENLQNGAEVVLSKEQSHYVNKVLRAQKGDKFLLFNGNSGEWVAQVSDLGKNTTKLLVESCVRTQVEEREITLVFSPTKNCTPSFIVQKATEIGSTKIIPCITERTVIRKVNEEKLLKASIEAAEQCNRLTIPQILPITDLSSLLSNKPFAGDMIWCDENNNNNSIIASFPEDCCAVIIGPEGGFSPQEQTLLSSYPWVHSMKLTNNILRADTAAIIALGALVMRLEEFI